jgi:hypothetical protein
MQNELVSNQAAKTSSINIITTIIAVYYFLLAILFYYTYFHVSFIDRYLGYPMTFYFVEFIFIGSNFILVDYFSQKNLSKGQITNYIFGAIVFGVIAFMVSLIAGVYFIFYLVIGSSLKILNYRRLAKTNQKVPKKDIFITIIAFVLAIFLMLLLNFAFSSFGIAPVSSKYATLKQGNMAILFIASYYLLQSIFGFFSDKIGLKEENIN